MAVTVDIDVLTNIEKSLKKIQTFQKKASGQFKKVGDAANKVVKNTGALSKGLSLAKTQLLGFGAALGGLLIIREISGAFLDFNTALIEVTTISKEAIQNQDALTESLIRSSEQFGTGAADQAKLFYQIVSAGIQGVDKQNELLIASNKLAIGGIAGTAESVDILTGVVNAYGQENISATRAADILFTTVKLGKTTVTELASALGLVLPQANALGVEFEDVTAAVAALTTKSISTSQAVTQLQGVFSAVIKNQERARQILGDNADAFSLQALRTKTLAVFLRDLNKAAGGSTEVLQKLLGRTEATNAVLALASDGFQQLAQNIEALKDATGAADEAFKRVNNTIGKQLDILKARLTGLVLRFFVENEGVFLSVIKTANESLLFLRDNTDVIARGLRRLGVALITAFLVFRSRDIIAQIQLTFLSIQTGAIKAATALTRARIASIALKVSITALKVAATLGLVFLIEAVIELAGVFNQAKNAGATTAQALNAVFLQTANFFRSKFVGTILEGIAFILDKISGFSGPLLDAIGNINPIGAAFASAAKAAKGSLAKIDEALAKNKKSIEQNNIALSKIPGFEGAAAQGGAAGGDGGKKPPKPKDDEKAATATGDATAVAITGGIVAAFAQGGEAGAIALVGEIGKRFGPIGEAFAGAASFLAQGGEVVSAQIASTLDALDDVIFSIVDGALSAVETLLDKVPEFLERLIERLPELLKVIIPRLVVIFSKILANPVIARSLAVSLAKQMPFIARTFVTELVKSAPRFIDALIDEISKGVTGGPGGIAGSAGGFLGFSHGLTEVPQGFKNDSFGPVGLTSKERVVSGEQNTDLKEAIDIIKSGQAGGAPVQMPPIVIQLNIGEAQLADILVNLDRQGFRTTA